MQVLPFDLRRKYWLATATLLTAGLAGWSPGVSAAIALTIAQLVHFAYREESLRTLTLQVRALYLALLLAGLWPPLAFLHVLLVIGAWVYVLYDYCAAARMLSLMPWNRGVPLSIRLVAWTLLSPPASGSILDRVPRPTGALPIAAPPAGARPLGVPAVAGSPDRTPPTRRSQP